MIDGVATGTETDNNAGTMIEGRFDSAAAGTNCLDGNPDDAWMRGDPSGSIGNNCPNGEASYELPLSESLGKTFESLLQSSGFTNFLSNYSRLINQISWFCKEN